MDGDFHWHKHDDTDEFFLVMEGHLDIELEDRMVSLRPGQAFTVPKGVMHCPHSRGRSVVLMVERAAGWGRSDRRLMRRPLRAGMPT
jgi:mannose-6-phosphate isomerase-like protein (cupin superfamily)